MEQGNILRRFIEAMRSGEQKGEDNFSSDFMVRNTANTHTHTHTHTDDH